MSDTDLLARLRGLVWRPGVVDMHLDLHDSIKTASVQAKVIADIRQAIVDWVPQYERMAKALVNDRIAAPTHNEKAFYAWAKAHLIQT